ncbi:hypothetical protein Q4560_01245 [Celeribacter halophilus]|uniref:Uncharacterized protein n=1 Tax=Celeribacter halophilus TaxID=576117 RepID=A0AAW7XN75_9RHOB|nr:hypothetical protein [Celeribacter halophilus]MBU2890569.1 hypothetical protein [Celeribacter halophilus]MDO6455691.1 hypothetical protein [Celeribacter halophilus]MDO6510267.1 hypothetical protein [Celeribacter halophilus]MDO6721881.1 hypothetical protein [Celeribacter halophilus]
MSAFAQSPPDQAGNGFSAMPARLGTGPEWQIIHLISAQVLAIRRRSG